MKLELIETKEKITESGDHYIRKMYDIEGYTVTVDDVTYSSGKTRHEIGIREPWDPNAGRTYLPEIYYYNGFMGSETPCFKIQTTAYGALSVEEFGKFLAAQQKGLEIAEVLNKELLGTEK